MSSVVILTIFVLGLFLLLSVIAGYLYYKMKKLSDEVRILSESSGITLPVSGSENCNVIDKLEERVRLLELKKNNSPQQIVKYLPAEPPIPAEPGKPGPPGPRGRTLIQDINQLFDGKDEIEVFTRLQENIPTEMNELEIISSTLSTDEEKNKSIEEIKKNLERNAKNLYGINNLRTLKKETHELCSEVILRYNKYINAFEKLHNIRESGSPDDKIQEALACKIELKNFQNKIDKFNTNLSIISQKKREFFLGDKAELEDGEEITREVA